MAAEATPLTRFATAEVVSLCWAIHRTQARGRVKKADERQLIKNKPFYEVLHATLESAFWGSGLFGGCCVPAKSHVQEKNANSY